MIYLNELFLQLFLDLLIKSGMLLKKLKKLDVLSLLISFPVTDFSLISDTKVYKMYILLKSYN